MNSPNNNASAWWLLLFAKVALLHGYGYGFSDAQVRNDSGVDQAVATDSHPMVLGHGVGLFKVGSIIAQDDFESLDNWAVQIQQKPGFEAASVEVRDNKLDCFLPGRGCTVWFKKKLATRVAITYEILCPTHKPTIKGITPRDINNFWMASDPADPEKGLFNSTSYTGAFGSYDKMNGYYASTGGRNNTTTRMRRYPRERDGKATDHIALSDKDESLGYMIIPDRVMKVQLVAYDDVVQYIVDGKLVYQIRQGDKIEVESSNPKGKPVQRESTYDLERFPVYREGYFGFRMVGTHHVYSNFKVHSLEPVVDGKSRATVHVDSLDALRVAIARSDQQIILQAGDYTVDDNEGFRFSGSNNDINLGQCHIEVPMAIASGESLFQLTGDHITLRGGVVEDTDPDGITKVTDFGAYNQRRKLGGMNEVKVSGSDARIIGMKMTIRGSFPYGYGNMYGIGRGNVVGLSKHCGIQIKGDRALVDSCDFKMEAFGHVIYVQGGDRTTVRNTHIEGTVRPSNDCYDETSEGDLAKRFKYQLQWPDNVKGVPIPRDHMINCTEDGIRAYRGAGEMIVENCVVKKCRGGIKLYMAKSARVTDCKVLDCVVQGYSIPSRGEITNSSGNAAYGPLLYVHFDSHHSQRIELEVLPAPHALGDHPLAAIKGQRHDITLTQVGALPETAARPIVIGYPLRFDFLCVNYPQVPKGYEKHYEKYAPDSYTATGIKIENATDHFVVLSELAKLNTVYSRGSVRDLGSGNTLHLLGKQQE